MQEALPVDQAAVEAIHAGCDLFIVSRQEELVWKTYETVLRQAEKANASPISSAKLPNTSLRLREKLVN